MACAAASADGWGWGWGLRAAAAAVLLVPGSGVTCNCTAANSFDVLDNTAAALAPSLLLRSACPACSLTLAQRAAHARAPQPPHHCACGAIARLNNVACPIEEYRLCSPPTTTTTTALRPPACLGDMCAWRSRSHCRPGPTTTTATATPKGAMLSARRNNTPCARGTRPQQPHRC